jgi:hypothetical protein
VVLCEGLSVFLDCEHRHSGVGVVLVDAPSGGCDVVLVGAPSGGRAELQVSSKFSFYFYFNFIF